jgi:hypothetical protein
MTQHLGCGRHGIRGDINAAKRVPLRDQATEKPLTFRDPEVELEEKSNLKRMLRPASYSLVMACHWYRAASNGCGARQCIGSDSILNMMRMPVAQRG